MRPARFALALLLLSCPVSSAQEPPRPTVKVIRVVDGDTVIVLLDGKRTTVRLLGVDTPESVDPRKPVQRFAHESADFRRGLIDGKTVRLIGEPAGAKIDRYGRTLAYLCLEPGGLFVNREIVAKGYGHAYVQYPFAYMDDFRTAERQAREKGLGLWGPDTGTANATAETAVWITKTGTK